MKIWGLSFDLNIAPRFSHFSCAVKIYHLMKGPRIRNESIIIRLQHKHLPIDIRFIWKCTNDFFLFRYGLSAFRKQYKTCHWSAKHCREIVRTKKGKHLSCKQSDEDFSSSLNFHKRFFFCIILPRAITISAWRSRQFANGIENSQLCAKV